MTFSQIDHRRFEWEETGAVAFADFTETGDIWTIPHVEAPLELRGTGAAGRLMRHIAELARQKNRRIRPLCPYAAAWLRKHAEFADLVA